MKGTPPGVSFPMPVVAVISSEGADGIQSSLDESRARQDDAYWEAFVNGLFTWPRFYVWWVARRYVMPRDITKG